MTYKKIIIAIMISFVLLAINKANAQTNSNSNKNPVKIAIIDTGYFGKTDYDEITFTNFNSRTKDEAIEPANVEKRGYSSLHGTWVAGVLLNKISVPANIISYRSEKSCLEIQCYLSVDNIIRAAKDAAKNGAEIIQISSYGNFGVKGNRQMAQIAASGVHIVISAGNEKGFSPLLDMAALNTDKIHIIGSLNKRGSKSDFSARDRKNIQLLKWRQGEDLKTFNPFGQTVRVTGTSYAASIFTAELANAIYSERQKSKLQVSEKIAKIIIAQNVSDSESDEVTISKSRVDLAASGELSVEKLTPTERIRLKSRAIRPSDKPLQTQKELPKNNSPKQGETSKERKSKAIPPV